MNKMLEKRVEWTVAELAEKLACRFVGDGKVVISGVAGLETAGEGDLIPSTGRFF